MRSAKKDVKKYFKHLLSSADPMIAVMRIHTSAPINFQIIENIRKNNWMQANSFNTRLVDFILDGNVISEIHTQEVNSGKMQSFKADAILHFTGHSQGIFWIAT